MYKPEIGDRVVVSKNDTMVKARVATVNVKFGRVGVTFKKNDAPTMYCFLQVFPLYRYVPAPDALVAAGAVPAGAQMIQPLFF